MTISQIPQCIRQISRNEPICDRNVHTCTFLLQNGALWYMRLVHCRICATGLCVYVLNSLRPRDTYMHHQTRALLVQIMACCLFDTKPLSEPMLVYCEMEPWKHIFSEMSIKLQHFSLRKMKISFANRWSISLGLNVLTQWGRVTHICISKPSNIVSDNGLSPGRHHASIWTNAGILSIWPMGSNFSEILIEIQTI